MNSAKHYIKNHGAVLGSGVICVAAIVIFVSATSGANNFVKIAVFGICAAVSVYVFLNAPAGFAKRDERGIEPDRTEGKPSLIEELTTLEEAAVFFSASLKTEELIRLLRVRLGDVLEGCEASLLIFDKNGELVQPDSGSNSIRGKLPDLVEERISLAELAVSRPGVVSRSEIAQGSDKSDNVFFAAATALLRGNEAFCVLIISSDSKSQVPGDDEFKAIAERVAPLISGSISFESSVSNALTDNLTQLPNERAMYLILENQIAEAQRFGKLRPLTLLSIDLDSFAAVNRRFGHSEGDKLLIFAAKQLQNQLRKMDLLARISDDEFLIILPKVSSKEVGVVIERITQDFEQTPYLLPEKKSEKLSLNFGSATFGEDGQSAAELLRVSSERKRVTKSAERGDVLRFPQADK